MRTYRLICLLHSLLLMMLLLGSASCHVDKVDTSAESDADTDTDVLALEQLADDVAGSWTPQVFLSVQGEAAIDLEDPQSLNGEVHYVVNDGAEIDCDVHIALTGTEYTGPCPDCDFAFTTGAEILDGEDCAFLHPFWTYIPGKYFTGELVLAWADHAEVYGYTFYDILAVGYPYGDSLGWAPMVFSSPQMGERGEGSYSEGTLSWSYYYSGSPDSGPSYYHLCDRASYVPWSTATEAYGATFSGSSSLPCDGEDWLDVWTVQAEVGQTLAITLDTVDEMTTFEPWFWVNSPSGCTVVYANDSFVCTYPPPYWGWCPSALVPVDEAGTWQVVAGAYDCAAEQGMYRISVELR